LVVGSGLDNFLKNLGIPVLLLKFRLGISWILTDQNHGWLHTKLIPNTGFYYENNDFSKIKKQGRRYLLPPLIELCGGACFASLLAHVFCTCVVLHETTQHGSFYMFF
jgi:hypothetical protein